MRVPFPSNMMRRQGWQGQQVSQQHSSVPLHTSTGSVRTTATREGAQVTSSPVRGTAQCALREPPPATISREPSRRVVRTMDWSAASEYAASMQAVAAQAVVAADQHRRRLWTYAHRQQSCWAVCRGCCHQGLEYCNVTASGLPHTGAGAARMTCASAATVRNAAAACRALVPLCFWRAGADGSDCQTSFA